MASTFKTIALLPLLLLAVGAKAEPPRDQPMISLDQLAQQLEPFKDVAYAQSQGYFEASECEAHPKLGVMGYHYVSPALLGLTAPVNGRVNGTGTYTGMNPPAILLYAPDGHGGKELVGIEMLVFAEAWHAENKNPPKFRGREWNYMADDPDTPVDEAHGFMPHYDLHIWLFAENPSGMYAQWNPALSCANLGIVDFHH